MLTRRAAAAAGVALPAALVAFLVVGRSLDLPSSLLLLVGGATAGATLSGST